MDRNIILQTSDLRESNNLRKSLVIQPYDAWGRVCFFQRGHRNELDIHGW